MGWGVGGGDPRVILTILRPCTTGGTKRGGKKEGWETKRMEVAEKWKDVEDRGKEAR